MSKVDLSQASTASRCIIRAKALAGWPGKGWGAFATKPIKRGSLILREKALFVIQKSTPEIMEVDNSKAAAEARTIALASRMVLHLLTVVLLEEEGLLDNWVVKTIEPGVVKPVALFLSGYNHEIGDLALTQDTWLKKLQVAFELYGRADPADEIMTRRFQLMGQVCQARVMAPWA
ncbi:unnamed protein product [Penicillium nalgiovense]|nr:unnamed protein product [Penicillium nalgiovense]